MKTFTVEGRGEFPRDMLHYDACTYASDKDRALGEAEIGCDNWSMRRSIALVLENGNGMFRPTVERWESFGWRVVRTELAPDFPVRARSIHAPITRDELTGRFLALLHEAREAGFNVRIDIERQPKAGSPYVNTVHVWERRK